MAGRGFAPEDTTGANARVIVSASAARKLFGARSAIGPRIVLDMPAPRHMEVVGVVAALLIGFAASAVLLAGLGIYGVVAYIVSQRSRELGLRLALGAQAGELVLATVRRSVWLVGGGVTAGLFAAIVGARLLGAFLYGIGTFDLATDVGVVVVVATLGLLATFIPARRITRIDPAAILKA